MVEKQPPTQSQVAIDLYNQWLNLGEQLHAAEAAFHDPINNPDTAQARRNLTQAEDAFAVFSSTPGVSVVHDIHRQRKG
jgi:hypothetical protein